MSISRRDLEDQSSFYGSVLHDRNTKDVRGNGGGKEGNLYRVAFFALLVFCVAAVLLLLFGPWSLVTVSVEEAGPPGPDLPLVPESSKGEKERYKQYFSDLVEGKNLDFFPKIDPLSNRDVVLFIDLQNDFIENPDVIYAVMRRKDLKVHYDMLTKGEDYGGRFAVKDGAFAAYKSVELVDLAAKSGAMIAFTRDYHPQHHVSFIEQSGPFPDHCLQSSVGSFLFPPFKDALERAVEEYKVQPHMVFKGFARKVDSFSAFKYDEASYEYRFKLHEKAAKPREQVIGGECALDWTRAFELESASRDFDGSPDVLSVFNRKPLLDVIKSSVHERIFLAGLAFDYCLIDSAANLRAVLTEINRNDVEIYIVFDATRPVRLDHLPPPGFPNSIDDVASWVKKYNIKLVEMSSLKN